LKSTVLARVAALAAVAIALSACSVINPITTQKEYQASDGIDVTLSDNAEALNLLVVTTAKDAPAVLTGSIHNGGTDDITVTLSIDGSNAANVTVAAGSTVKLGTGDGEQLIQGASPAAPGGLASVWVGTEELGAIQVQVPVVDGTLAPYDQIVDSIPPLPIVTPTPSPSPSVSPTS
jgi:hypothetical protein